MYDTHLKYAPSYLNNQGFSSGAAADDGFRDVVTLGSSLVVQHGSSDGCRPGKLNYPVAIEVVFTTKVLDSWKCTEVRVIVCPEYSKTILERNMYELKSRG